MLRAFTVDRYICPVGASTMSDRDNFDWECIGGISRGNAILEDFERSIAETKAQISEVGTVETEMTRKELARLRQILEELREGVLVFTPPLDQLLARTKYLAANASSDEKQTEMQSRIGEIEGLLSRFAECSRA
jgi:hypothetical protein